MTMGTYVRQIEVERCPRILLHHFNVIFFRMEMHIVGGFLDNRNISENVFKKILREYLMVPEVPSEL